MGSCLNHTWLSQELPIYFNLFYFVPNAQQHIHLFIHRRVPVKVVLVIATQHRDCTLRAFQSEQVDGAALAAQPEGRGLHPLAKSGGCACSLVLGRVKFDGLPQLCTVHTAAIVQKAQAGPFLRANLVADMSLVGCLAAELCMCVCVCGWVLVPNWHLLPGPRLAECNLAAGVAQHDTGRVAVPASGQVSSSSSIKQKPFELSI